MQYKIGVTIGKFMPLHKGHELMIEFGSKMLDKLYVIVSGKPNSEISVSTRYNWVCEFVERNNLSNVYVIYHIDQSPEPKDIDQFGTVLDKEFQEYWKNEFRKLVPEATHFVSSDRYGKTMGNLLGIEWLPVDPDRETVSISATEIRKDILYGFQYISDVAKPYFVKKVAIIGPESTGKSTMVKNLSETFGCVSPHEYGRTLSEEKQNDLSVEDFYAIVKAQKSLIEIATKKTNTPLIISDTEAFTTYLFGKIYLSKRITELYDEAVSQYFDLYIILAPTVKWVDDGTRVIPNQKEREKFFDDLVYFCQRYNKKYVIIDQENYSERYLAAMKEIEKLYS